MRFARLAGLLLVGCGGIARVDGSDPMSPKELVDPLFEAFAEDPAESLPITGPVNLDVDIFRGDVLVRRAEGLGLAKTDHNPSSRFWRGSIRRWLFGLGRCPDQGQTRIWPGRTRLGDQSQQRASRCRANANRSHH